MKNKILFVFILLCSFFLLNGETQKIDIKEVYSLFENAVTQKDVSPKILNEVLYFFLSYLSDSSIHQGYLHANVGNLYVLLQNYSYAFYHYRKALYFLPHNEEIKKNIDSISQYISFSQFPQSIFDKTRLIAEQVYLGFYKSFLLLVFLNFLFWGSMYFCYYKKKYSITLIFAVLLCIHSLLLFNKWHLFHYPIQGVIIEETFVYSGPRESYPVIVKEKIKIGNTFLIDTYQNSWLKIKFKKNYSGWVNKKSAMLY